MRDLEHDFKYYFDLPFAEDAVFLWDSKHEMIATIYIDDGELRNKIVRKINGDKIELSGDFTYDETNKRIRMNGSTIFLMRGFVYLVSCGLTTEEASQIQNELAIFIINQLNK